MDATPTEHIARAWLDAFNAHDVDRLVSLYAADATHTSPKIRVLHPQTQGKLIGHEALRSWWREALERVPGLRYELVGLTAGARSVLIEYVRHARDLEPMLVAEVFDVGGGYIVASRVYHG